MSTIDDSNGLCAQITVVKLDPGNAQEVLNLIAGAPASWRVSTASCHIVHRSKEGSPRTVRAWANSKIRAAGNGVATSLIPARPVLSERP